MTTEYERWNHAVDLVSRACQGILGGEHVKAVAKRFNKEVRDVKDGQEWGKRMWPTLIRPLVFVDNRTGDNVAVSHSECLTIGGEEMPDGIFCMSCAEHLGVPVGSEEYRDRMITRDYESVIDDGFAHCFEESFECNPEKPMEDMVFPHSETCEKCNKELWWFDTDFFVDSYKEWLKTEKGIEVIEHYDVTVTYERV